MKKTTKLTLHRETLVGLGRIDEVRVAFGAATDNTCYGTCVCRSAYTCGGSACACSADGFC